MKNKTVGTVKHSCARALCAVALIGFAALAPAMKSQAQNYRSFQFTNTDWGTAYLLAGGTNYLNPNNSQLVYQGGTNALTLTNAETLYSPATATPIYISAWQSVPVNMETAIYYPAGTTQPATNFIDLSPDGVFWITNAVAVVCSAIGGQTNMSFQLFPVTNGTNVFTDFKWARWGGTGSTATNALYIQQFQAQVFR